MKKFFVFIAGILFLGSHSALAAEYVVKKGDTLPSIAQKTNQMVTDLQQMNPGLVGSAKVKTGQILTYVSAKDIRDALTWCKLRQQEFSAEDENHIFYSLMVEDLSNKKIRYSISEPEGVHFELVLTFAKALKKNEKSIRTKLKNIDA